MRNRNRSRPLGRSLPEKEEEEEGREKCLLSYLFHTCTDRRFDIHSIDEWKGTMAKSDRAPFQIAVSDVPQSAVSRLQPESKGYIKAAPWTVQTQSRPMTCSVTAPIEELDKFARGWREIEAGPACWIGVQPRGHREVRGGICFHGYGPGHGDLAIEEPLVLMLPPRQCHAF